MDINVSFIEDCILLAKQCKMEDLIDELQHKCKQVYEYGKELVFFRLTFESFLNNSNFNSIIHLGSLITSLGLVIF